MSLHWPPLLAVIGAVVICGLVGLAFAPVAGRVRGIYLGVASLSLVFLGLWLGQSLGILTGGTGSGRPPPTFELFGFPFANTTPAPTIAGVAIQKQQRLWYLFLVFAVLAYVLAQGAVRGRIGRSWRAVRDNEAAAAAMGVSVARIKAGAFTISSAYAGLAGVMTALWLDLVKPDENEFTGNYSLTVSIAFLAIVIIGGLGSVPGAVSARWSSTGCSSSSCWARTSSAGSPTPSSAACRPSSWRRSSTASPWCSSCCSSPVERPRSAVVSLARVHHPTREERR